MSSVANLPRPPAGPWMEAGAAVVGGLTYCVHGLPKFVEAYIWSPSTTYFILLLVVILDAAGRAYLANHTLWKAAKAAGLLMGGYTLILTIAYWLRAEPSMMWLRFVVLPPAIAYELRSLIRTLRALRMMNADTADLLTTNITRKVQPAEDAPAEPEPVPAPEPTPAV